jgi:hypothetical protein
MRTPMTIRASRNWRASTLVALVGGLSLATLTASAGQAPAQPQPPTPNSTAARLPPPPPAQGKAGAPFDMTGYWVSIVSEDWMYRMVTPPKGDVTSLPMNPEGRRVTNTWDPSEDGSCKAYGAAALMRMPTRLRISWEADDVMRVETDAGQQTRRFIFNKPAQAGIPRSLQGYSNALWQFPLRSTLRGDPPPTGGASLFVTTTNLEAGWLRRNGVPYSADAKVTEYYDQFRLEDAEEWLAVTTLVDDPTYLTQQYVTSTHFRREKDGSKWAPSPCKPAR